MVDASLAVAGLALPMFGLPRPQIFNGDGADAKLDEV
jgi:hypothetical protein